MTLLAPRRPTRVLDVGGVKIGGDNPVVVQSMTTADTRDPAATLSQIRKLADRYPASRTAILPAPWRIPVTVLNGSGDINYTRQVASHVGAFGYTIKKVGRASNFGYPQTAVYFPPRCDGVALRLAKQLGVQTQLLPGGKGACQLFVIVGPARGPGE